MLTRIYTRAQNIYQFLIQKAKNINIDTINTVCFVAGPYRNLTSLTAAIAVLHPNCQVLNHAKDRILPHKKVDFFSLYSLPKFQLFVKYAVLLSTGGKRGRHGGSITHSHAFDKSLVKRKYYTRFGSNLLKENIQCLFWKEGLHLTNYLIKQKITAIDLVKRNNHIRYILPIRNPLDCAISNQKTKMAQIFTTINEKSSLQDILKEILDSYLKFFKNQQISKQHFFHFYEHSLSSKTLTDFCEFLKIPYNESWEEDVLQIFTIKPSYTYTDKDIAFYKKYIDDKFKDFPNEKEHLLKFIA